MSKLFAAISSKPVGAFIPFGMFSKAMLAKVGICVEYQYILSDTLRGIHLEENDKVIDLELTRINPKGWYDGFRLSGVRNI